MSTSEPYPLYNALRGTLLLEVNFTAWGYPCQKYLRGRFGELVKFTFRADPHQNAFWGTLGFEVNFTGWGDPCQKCLWSRFDVPVKFTFRAYPLQKGFWGRLPCEVERLCVYLRALPPLQGPQRHIGFEGEFRGLGQPLPEVPQRPIGQTREIHLRS